MLDTTIAARRITRTLFYTQVAVSAGLIMMSTINSIAGMELSGKASWAGIPAAVFLVSADMILDGTSIKINSRTEGWAMRILAVGEDDLELNKGGRCCFSETETHPAGIRRALE